MIVSILFVVLFACVVLAIVMCAAEYDRGLESTRDPHADLADDMHLAKVARIADAMIADREKAFADYLQTPGNAVPVIRKQTGDSA
jgi:hypothetical protein